MNSRTIQLEIQKGPRHPGFMGSNASREQRLSSVPLGSRKFTLIVYRSRTENEYNWKIQLRYGAE